MRLPTPSLLLFLNGATNPSLYRPKKDFHPKLFLKKAQDAGAESIGLMPNDASVRRNESIDLTPNESKTMDQPSEIPEESEMSLEKFICSFLLCSGCPIFGILLLCKVGPIVESAIVAVFSVPNEIFTVSMVAMVIILANTIDGIRSNESIDLTPTDGVL